jgi:hypothetical protein
MEEQQTYNVNEGEILSNDIVLNHSTANKLTYIGSLMEMFGYSDYRAIEKFLRENNIPILKVGRKKYALSIFINAYIQREIKRSLGNIYSNTESVLEAIENDDLEYLTSLTETNEMIIDSKKEVKQRSRSSQNFKNKLKEIS